MVILTYLLTASFKNFSCNNCGIKGHLQAVCREPKEEKSYSNRYKKNQPRANDKIKSVEVDKEDFLYNIGEAVNVVSKPEIFNFKLNGMLVALEIDSGACVSLLSDRNATQLGVEIKPVDKSFTAYGGFKINMVGIVNLKVFYNNSTCS